MKKIMIAAFETAEDGYTDYVEALKRLGAEGFISLNPEDLTGADALILPGSKQDMNPKLWGEEDQCSNDINDELDSIQWKLLEQAVADKKPVMGVCRGMQFINVFFGGTLIQDLSCGESHKAADPENYHLVFNAEGQFMKELFGMLTEVNSRHHQGAGRIGDHLVPASVWMDGDTGEMVTEAIAHESLPIIGLQWHPERMFVQGEGEHKEGGEKVLRYFLGL